MKIRKILIVDDDDSFRFSLRQMLLHLLEADIAQAANGKVALEVAKAVNPDLVITDIQMPVMDGLQLIKQLRQLYPFLPIIASSGGIFLDDPLQKVLKAGANHLLPKPYTERALLQSIRSVLHQEVVDEL